MNSTNIIDDNPFIEHLEGQYKAEYGFPPNEPLKTIWRQLETSLTTSLSSTISNKIQVLNPPTGSGKTHCLAEYCKRYISHSSNRSILVVVRTIQQANEVASQINRDDSPESAIASYAGNEVSIEDAQGIPILIITSVAYKLLLEARLGYSGVDLRSQKFLTYRSGLRQLTVIDEAIDFVKTWTSDLEKLKQTKAYIPKNISDKYPLELGFLSKVIDRLEEVTRLEKIHFNRSNTEYDFSALLLAMKAEKLDVNTVDQDNPLVKSKLNGRVKEALELLSRISEGFALVQRKGDRVIEIGTSVSLLSDQLPTNIIILDATAKSNPSYSLMASRVNLVSFPSNARDYSNLHLHVSQGHKIGKHDLYKNHKRELANLSKSITDRLGDEDSLLLICHKKLLEEIERIKPFSEQVKVANWGNLDGKNDWKDVKNMTVFGLPYLPISTIILRIFAMKGEQSNHWLQSKGDRPTDRANTLWRINRSHMVSDIIQAMNRCQIRGSINTEGLCPVTDIHILLPAEKESLFIINEIKSQMPNLKILDWEYDSALDGRVGSKYLEPILAYCKEHLDDPKIPLKEIGEALNIPKTTFVNLKETLNNSKSPLSKALVDLNLEYKREGNRRSLKQWLEPIHKNTQYSQITIEL